MRRTTRLFLLVLATCLFLAACSDEGPTLISGASTDVAAIDSDDVVDESEAMEDEEGFDAVAEASAPVEVPLTTTTTTPPQTTVPAEAHLARHPLLEVLDGDSFLSAYFILVDDDNVPIFSGFDEFPEFVVFVSTPGPNPPIEYGISPSNVEIINGQPHGFTINGTSSTLSEPEPGFLTMFPGSLPNTDYKGDPIPGFGSLFETEEINYTLTDTGFQMRDSNGETHNFMKFTPRAGEWTVLNRCRIEDPTHPNC